MEGVDLFQDIFFYIYMIAPFFAIFAEPVADRQHLRLPSSEE